MSPPELSREAPVADIREPVDEDFALIIGKDPNLSLFDRRGTSISQRAHLAKPLHGDARLDDGLAPVADAHGLRVLFDFHEQRLRFHITDDTLARLPAHQTCV